MSYRYWLLGFVLLLHQLVVVSCLACYVVFQCTSIGGRMFQVYCGIVDMSGLVLVSRNVRLLELAVFDVGFVVERIGGVCWFDPVGDR